MNHAVGCRANWPVPATSPGWESSLSGGFSMCPGRRGARRAGSSTVGCSDWAALWAWVQLGAEQRGLPRPGSIPAHRTASEAGELALPLTHVLTPGLCQQPPCSRLPSPTPEPRRAVSVLLAHPLSLCPARRRQGPENTVQEPASGPFPSLLCNRRGVSLPPSERVPSSISLGS